MIPLIHRAFSRVASVHLYSEKNGPASFFPIGQYVWLLVVWLASGWRSEVVSLWNQKVLCMSQNNQPTHTIWQNAGSKENK